MYCKCIRFHNLLRQWVPKSDHSLCKTKLTPQIQLKTFISLNVVQPVFCSCKMKSQFLYSMPDLWRQVWYSAFLTTISVVKRNVKYLNFKVSLFIYIPLPFFCRYNKRSDTLQKAYLWVWFINTIQIFSLRSVFRDLTTS